MRISFVQWAILLLVLLPSSVTDIKEQKVHVWLVVCGIAAGILNASFQGMSSLSDFILRFIPGMVMMVVAYLIKGCIGAGDGLVSMFLGSVINLKWTVTAIFLGFCLAAICGLLLITVFKKSGKTKIPYIPFLSMGVLLCAVI